MECPSCALEVEKNLEECPYCGYEFPTQSAGFRYAGWLFIALMLWPLFELLSYLFDW